MKTFDVPLVLDAIQEVRETIGLALSAPTGGATLGAQATSKVIIIDYSPSLPTVHVSDAQVVEGNSGTKNMNFTISLSPNSKAVTVTYQTADGTAVAGVDYQAVSDQVVFQPGDAPKTVSVPVIGDTDPEDSEVFYLVITGVQDGTVTDGEGEGVILDDDSPNSQAGCVGGTTIAKPKLVLSGFGDQPGNERFTFKGKLKFAVGAPAGMTPLDALGHGAQLKLEDLGSGTSSIVDLSTASEPIPAGALGQPCTASKNDGWTVNPSSTTYVYRNASGALAPACTAGSAHGLSRFKLMDRRSQVGRIAFLVKSRATTIAAPVGPVRATIILGADAADGLLGRCGTHTFDALSCTPTDGGSRIVCQ